MFKRIMPNDDGFFDLFRDQADQLVVGAKEFRLALDDLSRMETRARNIRDAEHKADEITHRTIERLHQTFIAPMDRNDIHSLISQMDDVLDFIYAASQRMLLYGITVATPEAKNLADLCVSAVEFVKLGVQGLDNLKDPKAMLQTCVEINRIENEADHILRSAIAKLFRDEPDLRQLIKLKEIYEMLETVTDRCEGVANIIEGIVLEYA